MIVVDASAIIALLFNLPAAVAVAVQFQASSSAHAPHLLYAEAAQVVRRFAAAGEITHARGRGALENLVNLPLFRHAHDPLLPRVWALRDNFTVYDALYVALAESLDAPLLTCDRRIAAAPGHQAEILLV